MVKNTRIYLKESRQPLTEGRQQLNELANPFKKIGDLIKGIKEESTYLVNGKEVSEDKFQSYVSLHVGKGFTSKQEQNLKLGNPVEVVSDEDGKKYTFQISSKKTTRTDRAEDKKAASTTNKSGELSDKAKFYVDARVSKDDKSYTLTLFLNDKKILVFNNIDTIKASLKTFEDSLKKAEETISKYIKDVGNSSDDSSEGDGASA